MQRSSSGGRATRRGGGWGGSSRAWKATSSARTRPVSGRPARCSATCSASPARGWWGCSSASRPRIRCWSRSRPGWSVTAERRGMSLVALLDALDAQRAVVLGYLDILGTDDLGRKARIPVFAPILGTDEVTLPVFVGAMFGMHWDAHADQIGQIRQAVGLSEAEYSSPAR